MRIVHISDTHMHEVDLEVPDGDLLIHSGDIDAREISHVVRFNNWLKKLPHKHKIFVPGNHDFIFEALPLLCIEVLTEAKVLINEYIEIEGVKIWGSPITPEFFDWAFMAPRGDKIKVYWDLIPNNIDVLITHGPPYKILDYVPRGGNVGCYDLMEAVKRIKPRYHLFGHIHEGYGTLDINWNQNICVGLSVIKQITTFINTSCMDGDYNLVNNAQVFEI